MVDVYDCSHGICVCIYMSVFYLLLIPAVVLFWFVTLGRQSSHHSPSFQKRHRHQC